MAELLRSVFRGSGRATQGRDVRSWRALIQRARRGLLPGAVLGGSLYFAHVLHAQLPIQNWFVWRYLEYWLVMLVWMAGCLSCGHALIGRVLRSPLPVLEQITMSFAVGVLAFFMLMYAGGLARLYGPAFFVALPLFMIGSGARPSLRYARRLVRGLRAARARAVQRPFALAQAGLWALGLVALFLWYIPAIVPAHISYDGAWYHLPLGEHYARLGRIEPLPEAWYPSAMPHLPSIVYCYAFLLPHGSAFDYVDLCAHLEFGSALMMLPGIPALVRRLAPGARAHASWAAYFIAFPGVYWFDLMMGGDQFSALWSVPICLALLRVLPELSWRHGLLLACGIAGEALTKYSASGVLAGPAMAVGSAMIWRFGKTLWQRRSLGGAVRAVSGGLVVGAAILVLSTPLWLKNWIWYGDPFYPLLYKHLHLHPWSEDAAADFRDFTRNMGNWQPPPGMEGIKQSAWAMLDHGFKETGYSTSSYRGSLFTLMCACLPFVRASWRVWVTMAVLHVGVFFWFLQMHQDRYLMAFIPSMAAVTVAVAILVWRASLVARVSLAVLVAFHTVWSVGVFGLSTPINYYRMLVDFTEAVYKGTPDAGLGDLARWERLGKTMPKQGKLLVHSWHSHTGIGHPSISDWVGFQGGISYGRLDSAAAVYQLLHGLGVTTLVWQDDHGDDSFAGDLRFFEFATLYTAPHSVEGFVVGTMPNAAPPAASKPQQIAFLSCADRYEAGLYPFAAMTVPNPSNLPQPSYPRPRTRLTPATEDRLLERARYAVWNPRCGFSRPTAQQGFVHIGQRDEYELFARNDAP